MSSYEVKNSIYGNLNIYRTDEDGTVHLIPVDPANSDYKRYLVDTKGGLPKPKDSKN